MKKFQPEGSLKEVSHPWEHGGVVDGLLSEISIESLPMHQGDCQNSCLLLSFPYTISTDVYIDGVKQLLTQQLPQCQLLFYAVTAANPIEIWIPAMLTNADLGMQIR